MSADIIVNMKSDNGEATIFQWIVEDNRHPDDGSYSNPLYYIPNDIARAAVESFDFIPTHMALGNKVVKLADTETLIITIPSYSELYKYLIDDNYPFI